MGITSSRSKLSLTMIVRDSSLMIRECLESVSSIIDEAIIVDTGSIDNTAEVIKDTLRRTGVRHQIVKHTPATNPQSFLADSPDFCQSVGLPGHESNRTMLSNYAAARQHGWDLCQNDLVLWLDSDDVARGTQFVPEILRSIKENKLAAAMIDYDYTQDAAGKTTCVLVRERIATRQTKWAGPIHEVLLVPGPTLKFKGFSITHRRQKFKIPRESHRNLKILLWHRTCEERAGRKVDPRILFYIAQESKDFNYQIAKEALLKYLPESGWAEERARAQLWLGDMAERCQEFQEAFMRFSASVVEYPAAPEGWFGLMRVCYFLGRMREAADHGMQGRRLMMEMGRHENLPFDPVNRLKDYPVYLSPALMHVGRMEEGAEVTREGLPSARGEDHERLLKNLQFYEDWKNQQPVTDQTLTQQADISDWALTAAAVELLRHVAREDVTRVSKFLKTLPSGVSSQTKILEAVEWSKKLRVTIN